MAKSSTIEIKLMLNKKHNELTAAIGRTNHMIKEHSLGSSTRMVLDEHLKELLLMQREILGKICAPEFIG